MTTLWGEKSMWSQYNEAHTAKEAFYMLLHTSPVLLTYKQMQYVDFYSTDNPKSVRPTRLQQNRTCLKVVKEFPSLGNEQIQ